MAALNRESKRFLDAYQSRYPDAQRAARIARHAVEQVARDTGALLHVVTARAKTPDSLRGKLIEKQYDQPDQELTDLVGVRVIAYYRDAVDPIVARLKQAFEINEEASADKRLALDLREFGYRSVHLIARVRPDRIRARGDDFIRERWFEIQVRSLLEHVWAEIEHEIVYKSGIKQPDAVRRRFAALAGGLELFDSEFLALREERKELIEGYKDRYERNEDQRKGFDVARLLGFLEAARPGLSWRRAEAEGRPFAAGLEVSCVEALKAAGMGTPASLKRVLRSARFRYALSSFAASQGIAPVEVSHLAAVVLAVIVKRVATVQHHFPNLIFDLALRSMVQRRTAR
jgi:ppGpp synthetase/RelA/SpoT-type nucleotidyltranferase